MKTTIKLRNGRGHKEIKKQLWSKPICLYCGGELPEDDRLNSVNYFKSIHNKCAAKLGTHRENYTLSEII